MSDEGKYIRVYYTVIDDPKFTTIIDDEATFGTWVRLLMSADAVWPSSADIPRWVKPERLQALVDAGVIELVPGDRFRVHGLNKERERRSQVGRAGGLASGRVRGAGTSVEPPANDRSTIVQRSGNLDEHRRDETSTSRDEKVPARARGTWPADIPTIVQNAWHRRMKRPPTDKQIEALRKKPATWHDVALLIDGLPIGARSNEIINYVLNGLTAGLAAERAEEASRAVEKVRGKPGGDPTKAGDILASIGVNDRRAAAETFGVRPARMVGGR